MFENPNIAYLMVKPGWNKPVYNESDTNKNCYSPTVRDIVQDVLSIHQLVPYIGILTCLTPDQLKIMYPSYANSLTFEYLADFYSKHLSLVLLVWDKMNRGDTVQRVLDLKKDYRKSTLGHYKSGLEALRKIPRKGRLTPDLSKLADRLKRGEKVLSESDGRDLTPKLVSTLYGSGAVVHSPSTQAESSRDLQAILGDRSKMFEDELLRLTNVFPRAKGMLNLYYLNPKTDYLKVLLDNQNSCEFSRKIVIEPYMFHNVLKPSRQLSGLGIIEPMKLQTSNGFVYDG